MPLLFKMEVIKIKNLSRQDRNGTRNSEELRRRYQFKDINYTKEEIEKLKMEITTDDHLSNTSTNPVQNKVITQALNTKVNKETGKGLSSNDFTDADKEKLDNFAAPTKVSQLENDANYIAQQAADIKYCTNESANEMNDSLETYVTLMERKVPTGGATGQVLTKKSDIDNDTYWTTPTGGAGGVTGDTLPIGSVVDYEGDTVPENWVRIEDEETEWITATLTNSFQAYNNNSNNVPKYKRIGNMVSIHGVITPASSLDGGSSEVVIFTLPTGYRPSDINRLCICQGSSMNRWLLTVTTDGGVCFSRYGTTGYASLNNGAWLPFDFTFMI